MGSSAQAADVPVFSPVSPPALAIRNVFLLVGAVCFGIFLIVEGALLYMMIRFRSGHQTTEGEPAQIYGSARIEVAWTIAPLMIVFVLFLVVVRVVAAINQPAPPKDALKVDVIAHQWWWEFRYPTLGFTTANELHVRAGSSAEPAQPVYLRLQSADVVHSFWVPQLAGKTDVFPNHVNHMWFSAEEPGVYHGQCAEYCGMQHADMKILVYADPPDLFRRWVQSQQAPAVDDPAVTAARSEFFSLACIQCHTIRNTAAQGTNGPDLTHLMSRRTIGAMGIPNTPENLSRWVDDAQALKPGCKMPSLHLDPNEVELVVEYLSTLR